MWLPKNERRLLSYYQSQVGGAGICQKDSFELENALCKKGKHVKNQIDEKYVMNVIKTLQKCGLIRSPRKVRETGQIEVELTQEAINLGRKYSSWWFRSNLWYAEYIKNTWIWLVVSFVSGIIATLLAQLLLRVIV